MAHLPLEFKVQHPGHSRARYYKPHMAVPGTCPYSWRSHPSTSEPRKQRNLVRESSVPKQPFPRGRPAQPEHQAHLSKAVLNSPKQAVGPGRGLKHPAAATGGAVALTQAQQLGTPSLPHPSSPPAGLHEAYPWNGPGWRWLFIRGIMTTPL